MVYTNGARGTRQRLCVPATPGAGQSARARLRARAPGLLLGALLVAACARPADSPSAVTADVLLLGGHVLDGAGNPWLARDIAITGDRITFVGNAAVDPVAARDTVNVAGLLVTPGFWDAHSHAELETPEGKTALPFLYQGITTVVLGIDGDGADSVAAIFAAYRSSGIAVNALHYVGHNAARRAVMGMADRAPTPDELERMKAYVERGMREGAVGLSTGLFYTPGSYAKTDEVIELNRVAARFGGIYDTHDRDLGASWPGIGFLESMKEAIEIGERAGTPVIFSHLNPQGAHNYGRAPEAARLIEEARARGVNVMAAQHPYTATQSNLAAYALPRWAAGGGRDSMRARFADAEVRRRLDAETTEMLAIRGGAEKIMIVAEDSTLNGRTLARVAAEWGLPVPETVRRILAEQNPPVMNHDLYDMVNTRYLATREWMMTCTDGRTPHEGQDIVHPRVYGAFSRKLRLFALDDSLISLPFAVRGMTSLPASFFAIPERGELRPGWFADIAVFDLARLRDAATYEEPHHYSAGTVHVLVNGVFAIRDGQPTGSLTGQPIPRPGSRRTS
jgi:N-acyl-D-amino-acid deacylase